MLVMQVNRQGRNSTKVNLTPSVDGDKSAFLVCCFRVSTCAWGLCYLFVLCRPVMLC